MPKQTGKCPTCQQTFSFSGSKKQNSLDWRETFTRHKQLHAIFEPKPSTQVGEDIKKASDFLENFNKILRLEGCSDRTKEVSIHLLANRKMDHSILLNYLTKDLSGNRSGILFKDLSDDERLSLEQIMISFYQHQKSGLLIDFQRQRTLTKITKFHGKLNADDRAFAEGLIELFQENLAYERIHSFERSYAENIVKLNRLDVKELSSAMETLRLSVETMTHLPIYLTIASAYRDQLPDKKLATEAIRLFTNFVYHDVNDMIYNESISSLMRIIHSEYLQESRDHLHTAPIVLCEFYNKAKQQNQLVLSKWKQFFCERSCYLKKTCMSGVTSVNPSNVEKQLQAEKDAANMLGFFSQKEVAKAAKAVRKRTAPKPPKP